MLQGNLVEFGSHIHLNTSLDGLKFDGQRSKVKMTWSPSRAHEDDSSEKSAENFLNCGINVLKLFEQIVVTIHLVVTFYATYSNCLYLVSGVLELQENTVASCDQAQSHIRYMNMERQK